MTEIIVATEEVLPAVAQSILQRDPATRIFVLHGEMGSGKTTLVRALCAQLGVAPGEVNSPTYALINEYAGSPGPIFHMDLYRLQDIQEALDIGVEDYLYSGHYCFVEWPDLIAPILPEETRAIMLELTGNSARKILF